MEAIYTEIGLVHADEEGTSTRPEPRTLDEVLGHPTPAYAIDERGRLLRAGADRDRRDGPPAAARRRRQGRHPLPTRPGQRRRPSLRRRGPRRGRVDRWLLHRLRDRRVTHDAGQALHDPD